MTNILIPTDFSANSLKIAEQAVQFLQKEVNIILFHAYEMPFHYQDMVRNSRPPYHAILNDDFRQSCKQLKDRYPRLINKISFQYMQGNTNALFRNFAEANDIHLIVCPASYVYTKTHSASLNPIPFFRKSRIPVLQALSLIPKNITMPAMQAATAFATA